MDAPERARLSYGVRLARLHQSPALVFWTSADWEVGYAVQASRLDPERVNIAVRSVGKAGFVPTSTLS